MSLGWGDADPATLGPYRIVGALGRGASGVVYRGFSADGRAVAVKTVWRATTEAVANLRAEIYVLRKIAHPNVVSVIEDGVEAGRPWFAMEIVTGETLASYSRAIPRTGAWTPATLQPILSLVAAICEPLAAMHDCGLVHRDLKPDNIILRDATQPVIVDFGLARAYVRSDLRASVIAEPIAGTLAYMAPEQLMGELGDARADLYALGCVIHELLVGEPPFAEDESPIGDKVGGVPPSLEALVSALRQPRPRDRIGNAHDVLRWLSPTSPREISRSLFRPLFAGRRAVLRQLHGVLDAARAGRGDVILLEGESGIGKTHLASELGRIASQLGAVISGENRPRDVPAPPLSCFSGLFEYAVDRAIVAPSSPVAAFLGQHAAVLAGLHPAFDRVVAHQARLVAHTADEVMVVLRDLIGCLATERPIVLILDDVQWADELALGVLRLIAGEWCHKRAVLVVATLRTDDVAIAIDAARRVRLGPLERVEVQELVADMLGVGTPPDRIVDWVAGRAEGNPFLVAEYLRLLVSELALDRELALPAITIRAPGRDELARLPAPGSVKELVMRRLGQLGTSAFALAEMIAVLGGNVTAEALASFDGTLADALFELGRAQVIEPTDDGGRRLLHDRIRVVLYDQIEPARRSELHRRAAELLTTTAAQDPPHASIAQHFLHADQPIQALPHLERAGEVALARAAYDVAAASFEELRALGGKLAGRSVTLSPAQQSTWSLGAARAHYYRGDIPACEARVREALALVDRQLPTHKAGWIGLVAREAIASQLPLRPVRDHAVAGAAHAVSLLPYRFFFAEDLLPLVATALLASNLARRARIEHLAAGPRSLLAAMAGLFRLTKVARRGFDEAAATATTSGDHREAAQVRALQSMVAGSFGRMTEAEHAARDALAHCRHSADPWVRENVETAYAHVEYFTGRFDDARRRSEMVAASARERGNDQHEIWGTYLQARSHMATGNWRDAEPLLRTASDRLQAAPEVISQLVTRGLLAQVELARGELAAAAAHAAWVTNVLRARPPTAYPSLVGYTSVARVWTTLVARDPTPAHQRGARDLAIALLRFAVLFPVALPWGLMHLAEVIGGSRWLVSTARQLADRAGTRPALDVF